MAHAEYTSEKPSLGVLDAESTEATTEQVKVAIEALSSNELYRLERYARYRMRGLGRKADIKDYEDLLRESMVATLSGDRKWKVGAVDFSTHLMGVMRSLSSHWREKQSVENKLFRAEGTDSRQPQSDLEGLASDVPDAERVLGAKEEWASICDYFLSDQRVSALLEGFLKGWEGQEIRQNLNWSQTEYETVTKRLRRGLLARARRQRAQ